MLGRPVQCNDHFYQGYLDEVKIWQRPLSATEVYQEYKRGTSATGHNLIKYSFLKTTWPVPDSLIQWLFP